VDTIYVSYDGALDPLGASQVVPLLLGLAREGVRPTLISFEKAEAFAETNARRDLERRLAAGGVRWVPCRYHRAPRVPATLWDVIRGARAVATQARRTGTRIVHCRGDVAMLMARAARMPSTRLLYDLRGFFADERVESGSWRRGSLLDRVVRAQEARNLARADALVVLTRAALPFVAARRSPLPPHRVIPTSVDVGRFERASDEARAVDYGLAYLGSIGTWYMTTEMIAFARVAGAERGERVLFLTPNPEEARRYGLTEAVADVRSARPAEVPTWLRRARAVFFFIRPTPAKKASCPTKLGEALAAGLPVVTNRGIGDVDEVVQGDRVGVLIDDFHQVAYRDALRRLDVLLAEPDLADRCRTTAGRRFGLDAAIAAYHDLYRILSGAA
jgi:glycosyltransferase involved in cell wall biosynthesis